MKNCCLRAKGIVYDRDTVIILYVKGVRSFMERHKGTPFLYIRT